jgi:PKD repeat protein
LTVKDNEGSAYVPRDGTLWLADDDGRALWEIDATTGAVMRKIDKAALTAVVQYGGTTVAGVDRPRDLESLAYDSANDVLYAFSGTCCNATVLPTVFRFVRQGTKLQLDSYQPLPPGSDNTASAWSSGDGKVYVGNGKNLRTYDYQTNTFGSPFQVSGLSGVLGMDFTPDGRDLFITTSAKKLVRVAWSTRTLVPGWSLDLAGFGIADARAVGLVGDKFFVSDGYDARPVGDPLAHAVYVLDVSAPGTPPVASFTMTPTSGEAPLSVQLSDTSTGGATSWSWSFGDGSTSTAQNPTHVFSTPGTWTITLTATNAVGSSTVSHQLEVSAPPPEDSNLLPNPDFEAGTGGWNTAGYAAVTLDRTPDAHGGAFAARLANTGATSVTSTLNDAPDAVQSSKAGTYHGSLWVRGDASTVGLKVYLRLREMRSGTKLAETSVPVRLTTAWQQVTGTITPTSPGTSTIDFAAALYSAPAGSVFLADDASLTHTP